MRVDLERKSRWTRQILALGREGRPLLVLFEGGASAARPEAGSPAGENVLRILTALYEAVGAVEPRWRVVPLFQFCGWDAEAVRSHFDVDDEVRQAKESFSDVTELLSYPSLNTSLPLHPPLPLPVLVHQSQS